MTTNTVLVARRQALSPIPEESLEERERLVFVEHIHHQIDWLQRQVSRAKRQLARELRNSRSTIGRETNDQCVVDRCSTELHGMIIN